MGAVRGLLYLDKWQLGDMVGARGRVCLCRGLKGSNWLMEIKLEVLGFRGVIWAIQSVGCFFILSLLD